MALAAVDVLMRIVPVDPPFSVVLTDWLSLIPAPRPKVMVDDPPWGQVMRQHAPGAAAAQEIEEGVQDFTLRVRFRSAAWSGFGNQMFDQDPRCVTEVGRVRWSCLHSPDRTRPRSANATFWTPS